MEDSLTLHGIFVQWSFIIGLVAVIYLVIPKGSSLALNGLGLCDAVAFKAQMFNNPPKLNRCTQLGLCTSATI